MNELVKCDVDVKSDKHSKDDERFSVSPPRNESGDVIESNAVGVECESKGGGSSADKVGHPLSGMSQSKKS